MNEIFIEIFEIVHSIGNRYMSLETKSKIVQLFKEKWPVSGIIDLTEVPKSTVYYLFSKYKRTGAVTNGRSTGRPRKLTWREEKRVFFIKNPSESYQ